MAKTRSESCEPALSLADETELHVGSDSSRTTARSQRINLCMLISGDLEQRGSFWTGTWGVGSMYHEVEVV